MLNEEKVAEVLELIRKSKLESSKQKELFIRLSDMKCAGMTDECLIEIIGELLGEIDVYIERVKEIEELENTIEGFQTELHDNEIEISKLEDDVLDKEYEIKELESEIEDLHEQVNDLTREISDLKDQIEENL